MMSFKWPIPVANLNPPSLMDHAQVVENKALRQYMDITYVVHTSVASRMFILDYDLKVAFPRESAGKNQATKVNEQK